MNAFLDAPIPARPDYFGPDGAPPGIALRLNAYHPEWLAGRPTIKPRVLVVHTNGGGGEGSSDGAVRWSNSAPDNTHAHYNLNAPTPQKNLRTDRRAIANSTPSDVERQYGERDCSYWTIAVETADRGYKNGGNADLGDFLHDHAELLARLIAYESIVWDFPIAVPERWNGEGVATHTAPWDGVYTIYRGKSCPGTTKKKRVLEGDILPRARKIANAWKGVVAYEPPPVSNDEQDEDVNVIEYFQLPPQPKEGCPWYYVRGGDVRVATAHDTKNLSIPRVVDDSDEGWQRYEALHASMS